MTELGWHVHCIGFHIARIVRHLVRCSDKSLLAVRVDLIEGHVEHGDGVSGSDLKLAHWLDAVPLIILLLDPVKVAVVHLYVLTLIVIHHVLEGCIPKVQLPLILGRHCLYVALQPLLFFHYRLLMLH